ncbi:hypothetical protein GOP47_0000080 [Adiantum capillus-veneris]|uniref:Exocyst subunit Exo70 family protein n=1 Tax=Adiantum capillus-veneris TaxID=13818 RepID=A0A9D4VCC9_ADICA|nr:hypothetical protein GOP47_0000080 [Adiantum capillus-veneris]
MICVDKLQEVIDFFKDNCWLKDSAETLHNAENLQKKAVAKLEDVFRHTLTENSNIVDPSQLLKLLSQISESSAEIQKIVSISCANLEAKPEEECDTKTKIITLPNLISPASFFYLHEVAKRMIFSGYTEECLRVYREVRSSILEHMLQKVGIQNLQKDGTQKDSLDSADVRVSEWPKHLQLSILLLFAGEQKLCDRIFDHLDPHRSRCFVSVVETSMCALLNFAEAVTASKRHSEFFFRILDMYNAMDVILPEVKNMFQEKESVKLYQRYDSTLHMLAQTSLQTFHTLEQTVLQILNVHELMNESRQMVGTGLSRSLLKERLKLFNRTVDELYRKQMQWTVHDPQLRKALQKAVVESVVPTYGLFLKRFSEGLDRRKNDQKYIKYNVEELVHLLKELFEGKTS